MTPEIRSVTFTLSIDPVAKGRPRFTRSGRVYSPKETVIFEREISAAAMIHRPDEPFDFPIKLKVNFGLPRPKKPKFEVPAVKPDLDNYVKAIKDALNGIIWTDDSRVCEISATKFYLPKFCRVGMIRVHVSELLPGEIFL